MTNFNFQTSFRRAVCILGAALVLQCSTGWASCAGTTATGSDGAGKPPGDGGIEFEDPYKKSYSKLITEAIHGKCLRAHPDALYNFYKTLGMVWMFQVGGYLKLERYITGAEETPKGVSTDDYTPEFPFAVLANTAFIIRLQSEVGCNLMFEKKGTKQEEPSYSMAPKAIFERYRSFAKLTPLAATTAFGAITIQKLMYVMADELSERAFGYDLGHYQSPLTLNFARSVATETVGIVGFELFFLFPKWALYETWLMNRGFPALKGAASALGSKLPGMLSYAPGAAAASAEWGYRLAVPILVDNPVLFEMMEHDGLSLGELPFAKYYVPKEKQDLVFFYPEGVIETILKKTGLRGGAPTPESGTVSPTEQ